MILLSISLSLYYFHLIKKESPILFCYTGTLRGKRETQFRFDSYFTTASSVILVTLFEPTNLSINLLDYIIFNQSNFKPQSNNCLILDQDYTSY